MGSMTVMNAKEVMRETTHDEEDNGGQIEEGGGRVVNV